MEVTRENTMDWINDINCLPKYFESMQSLLDSQAAEIEKLKAQLEKYEPKEILSEQCKDCKSEFGHPDNCIGCPEKPIPIPKEQLTGNEMVKKAFEEIKEGELSEILKQSQKDFERPVS